MTTNNKGTFMTKTFGFSVLLATAIAFAWIQLGFDIFLLLTLYSYGMGVYLILDGILSKETKGSSNLKLCIEYMKNNYFLVIMYCLFVSMTVFFYCTHDKPLDPTITQIQDLIRTFGLSIVVIYPVSIFVAQIWIHDDVDNNPKSLMLIGVIIKTIFMYSMILWVTGQFGDDIKVWITLNPDAAVSIAVTALPVWFIMKFSYASLTFNQNYKGAVLSSDEYHRLISRESKIDNQ